MYRHSGQRAGLVGTALTIALMDTLVDKGVLTKTDAYEIVARARDELRSYGNSVAIVVATNSFDEWVLPRLRSGKPVWKRTS